MSQKASGSPAPRHARHAADGQGASQAPRKTASERGTGASHFAGSTTRHYQGYVPHDSYDSDGMAEQAAPRPVLDPAETGSFQRIDAGMGARVETRENVERISADSTASWKRSGYGSERRLSDEYRPQTQSREPKRRTSHKLVAVLALLVVAVVCAGGYYVYRLINQPEPEEPEEQEAEQAVVDIDQSVHYRGSSYYLSLQDDGSYALVSAPDDGASPTVLYTLPGTPARLVLYNGTIVIPENLDGSWDVLAYTIGMGTPASQVVDSSGLAISGAGTIQSVELGDTGLVITDDTGASTEVALSGTWSSIEQLGEDSSTSAAESGEAESGEAESAETGE